MNNIFQILIKSKIQFKYKKMKEICLSISSGLNPRQNFKLNTVDAKNYYVTVKEISTNSIVFSEKTDLINGEAITIIQKRSKLEKNDLLLSGIGTIGKVAIVDIDIDNWNCSESILLIKPNQNLITSKFLRYFLLTDSIQKSMIDSSVGSTLKGIRKEWLNNLLVPIPPLEIQNEIVRILDKYTELEKELEKELELRTKQYEYYRNKLLNNQSHPKEKLSNIVQLNKFKQIGASELESFVDLNGDVTLLPSSRNYDWKSKKEDVKKIICNGKVIALGRARHPNIKYCDGFFVSSNNHLISLENENKVLMRYLYHFIDSKKYSFYVETSTYPKFDSNIFKNTFIPIPSIQEQQKIVDILDKSLNIVKDFKNGIPKQIELINKKYLYFRNKLLNFKVGDYND